MGPPEYHSSNFKRDEPMAAIKKDIQIGDNVYPVLFSANALRRLEEQTGMSIMQLGYILQQGLGTFNQMHCIVWAGLEGGRIRAKTRPNPFTMDEVGDLIDEAGGPGLLWGPTGLEEKIPNDIIEAWRSAFPQQVRPELKAVETADPNDSAAS